MARKRRSQAIGRHALKGAIQDIFQYRYRRNDRRNVRVKREPFAGLIFITPRWWIDSAGNRHQVCSVRTVNKMAKLGFMNHTLYGKARHVIEQRQVDNVTPMVFLPLSAQ